METFRVCPCMCACTGVPMLSVCSECWVWQYLQRPAEDSQPGKHICCGHVVYISIRLSLIVCVCCLSLAKGGRAEGGSGGGAEETSGQCRAPPTDSGISSKERPVSVDGVACQQAVWCSDGRCADGQCCCVSRRSWRPSRSVSSEEDGEIRKEAGGRSWRMTAGGWGDGGGVSSSSSSRWAELCCQLLSTTCWAHHDGVRTDNGISDSVESCSHVLFFIMVSLTVGA